MNAMRHTNAFVIQFRTDTNMENVPLGGRVEHVATGRTGTFDSVHELPALLQRMMHEVQAEPSGT
jgi:hypothetical protein